MDLIKIGKYIAGKRKSLVLQESRHRTQEELL